MSHGMMRRVTLGLLAACVPALTAGAASLASAHPRAVAASCRNTYEADYVASAVHLRVTRIGHWVAPFSGVTVDATQTDMIAPVRDTRDKVKLEVDTVCHNGAIRFLDERRRGTSTLTGQWSRTAGGVPTIASGSTSTAAPTDTGACRTRRTWGLDRQDPAFRVWVGRPHHDGGTVSFAPSRDVTTSLQFVVRPPAGLTCKAPIPARFGYPADVDGGVLAADPITLSVRDLQRDRRFTIQIAGKAGPRRELWRRAPASDSASVTYTIAWSGTITFTPMGCRHDESSKSGVHVLHDCA